MNNKGITTASFQLFYTFFYGFDEVLKTVRIMVTSGDVKYYMRAEKICETIAHYINGVDSPQILSEMIRPLVDQPEISGQVNKVLNSLNTEGAEALKRTAKQFDQLSHILLLQSTIHPETPMDIETEALTETSKGREQITLQPSLPISGSDLEILNYIAKCYISEGEFLTDHTRKFKHPDIQAAIKRLYYTDSYYFEQAFGNTDVRIQTVLLDIIEKDLKHHANDKNRKAAFDELESLSILSAIETSANKMTSKVSDHQAFEMFLHVLEKNNNNSVISKLVQDDIIMNTMFQLSSKGIEHNYGFRRMIIAAKYPYDSLIVTKFKKLMVSNDEQYFALIKDLCKDKQFLESWSNYLKSEKTKTLMDTIDKRLRVLNVEGFSNEMVEDLIHFIQAFTLRDQYNNDLMTTVYILHTLEQIYGYLLLEDRIGKYQSLERALTAFYSHRVGLSISTDTSDYDSYEDAKSFGITHYDMWYDVSKFLKRFDNAYVKRVYLIYDNDLTYHFDVGGTLVFDETPLTRLSQKSMPSGHIVIKCSNFDDKGFDAYIFSLFSRLVKSLMDDHIEIQVSKIVGSGFRKSEVPGLSTKDEQRIRKIINEYITLLFLWEKDSLMFSHIYKWRVTGILESIESIKVNRETLKKYVKIKLNPWIEEVYLHKAYAAASQKDLFKLRANSMQQGILVHGENFFKLAYPEKLKKE